MGNINFLAVLAAAAAFFVIGAIWYGILFGKIWRREVGIAFGQAKSSTMVRTFALSFLFELLIALMLGHNIARTDPQPHVIMMMALGFAGAIMVPAIGINYLYQQRSGKLFAIDAGHFIVGMAAMGAIFIWLR